MTTFTERAEAASPGEKYVFDSDFGQVALRLPTAEELDVYITDMSAPAAKQTSIMDGLVRKLCVASETPIDVVLEEQVLLSSRLASGIMRYANGQDVASDGEANEYDFGRPLPGKAPQPPPKWFPLADDIAAKAPNARLHAIRTAQGVVVLRTPQRPAVERVFSSVQPPRLKNVRFVKDCLVYPDEASVDAMFAARCRMPIWLGDELLGHASGKASEASVKL